VLPNFFARESLLVPKNNHGSLHPCPRKYSVQMTGNQNYKPMSQKCGYQGKEEKEDVQEKRGWNVYEQP
jgi:hypothetical protein